MIKILKVSSLLLILVLLAACTSPPGNERYRACISNITIQEMQEAQLTRAKYAELFQTAETVAEAKAAENEIKRVDDRIEILRKRMETESIARPSPRKIVYGPLGFVLNVTEFILEKLFILKYE